MRLRGRHGGGAAEGDAPAARAARVRERQHHQHRPSARATSRRSASWRICQTLRRPDRRGDARAGGGRRGRAPEAVESDHRLVRAAAVVGAGVPNRRTASPCAARPCAPAPRRVAARQRGRRHRQGVADDAGRHRARVVPRRHASSIRPHQAGLSHFVSRTIDRGTDDATGGSHRRGARQPRRVALRQRQPPRHVAGLHLSGRGSRSHSRRCSPTS